MRCSPRLALLAGLVTVLGLPAATPAQIWVFTDENGVVHLTDSPRHSGFRVHPSSVRRPPRGATRAWDGVIAWAARSHGVAPALVKAVIHAESNFDVTAISRKGALGLMQLMPSTARSLGVEDPFDPWQNIQGGTRHLRYLMGLYGGDAERALAAYNAGERAVERYDGIPPFRETRTYVTRVLALYRRYDADFR